jgi:hypothetical protein
MWGRTAMFNIKMDGWGGGWIDVVVYFFLCEEPDIVMYTWGRIG